MVSCDFSFPKCEIEKHKQRQQKWCRVILVFPNVKSKNTSSKKCFREILVIKEFMHVDLSKYL